ncbi:hypothetical protein GCM10010992_17490 [Cloacibacterium rupense]|uniref:Uncharacterized protein n=1 Tax=Cloacibacterium rupense TaxID=517423 RepID=A0ABQ2NJ06_9FLAO|nr:hypothetical protein [Cloacibacterium rupense]GGP04558.1 hypothetical protein GCM10010992_17490 [Cloacibacterium rupense]
MKIKDKIVLISLFLSLLYIGFGTYISSFDNLDIELKISTLVCGESGNPRCELTLLFFSMPSYGFSRMISMFFGGEEFIFYIVQTIMIFIYSVFLNSIFTILLFLKDSLIKN